MKETLVAVFPDEKSAYAGLDALKDLQRRGDVTLSASTVCVKERDGSVKVRAARERGPIGILVGLVGGGLIGGLGGPISAVAGACVGFVGGLVYDVFDSELDIDLVDEVGAVLEPGSFSVIADVDAGATPVDTRLAAYGGRVLRRVGGQWVGEQQTRRAMQTALVLRGMTS